MVRQLVPPQVRQLVPPQRNQNPSLVQNRKFLSAGAYCSHHDA